VELTPDQTADSFQAYADQLSLPKTPSSLGFVAVSV